MGLFRRIAGFLGFAKEDNHDLKDEEDNDNANAQSRNRVHMQQTGLPRKGFSVPVQVAVNRSNKHGPIILPIGSGDGGVQVHLFISFFPFSSFTFSRLEEQLKLLTLEFCESGIWYFKMCGSVGC